MSERDSDVVATPDGAEQRAAVPDERGDEDGSGDLPDGEESASGAADGDDGDDGGDGTGHDDDADADDADDDDADDDND